MKQTNNDNLKKKYTIHFFSNNLVFFFTIPPKKINGQKTDKQNKSNMKKITQKITQYI